MNIGECIKSRRQELEISVDDLAKSLGKNRATIYRYENGDIENLPTTVLKPLAEALHTSPEYLMGWTDNPIKEDLDNDDYIRLKNIFAQFGYELEELKTVDVNYFTISSDRDISFKAIIDAYDLNTMLFDIGDCISTLISNRFEKMLEAVKQLKVKDNGEIIFDNVDAAHAIDGASKEDLQYDNDIMDGKDF